MKKDKQSKQAAARTASWLPGGAHRIAHEARMQNKKTSPETYRTPITVAEMKTAVGHPKAEIACEYYRSACLLLLMERPEFRKSAEHLIAEADAILGADA